MGIFDGCLLACDIDGTLMASGVIPTRNFEAIDFFTSEGGNFSIATGRTVSAFNAVLREVGSIAPCVVSNGCMIYDYSNKKILYEQTLSSDDYYIVDKVRKSGKNIGIEIHSGEKIFALCQTQESIDHQTYEELEVIYSDFDEICKCSWNKAIFMVDNRDDLLFLKEFVKQFEHKCAFVETSAIIDGRKRLYFEMTPNGINKSTGLLKLSRILDIKDGCVFAIGDYYNDLQMIKNADIGAAVADSPDDIKSQADFVAGECKTGAVADFINYLYEKRKDANDEKCDKKRIRNFGLQGAYGYY